MATELIGIGAGDSEQGHYTITPGGHLSPETPQYTFTVGTADEVTFDIVPDPGWLIGMVYIHWDNPGGYFPLGQPIGAVASHTFKGMQADDAPVMASIFAYAFPHTEPEPEPIIETPFPWFWLVVAGMVGVVIGGQHGKHKIHG